MANQYLVEIHNHLRWQIEKSRQALKKATVEQDDDGRHFYEGKLDELTHMRDHLSEHYNLFTQRYD